MIQIISIAGSSGVGKSTLAKIIQHILGDEKTLLLSGDDLHKHERDDPIWLTKTHLDPESNDLNRGFDDLLKLKSGESIIRKKYCHNTGKFYNNAIAKNFSTIIYEGLHALYDERIAGLSNIKIFVDTDRKLKTEWKLKRDTNQRGYTKEQVLEIIQRRQSDDKKYIAPQKKNADIIFSFRKEDDDIITLSYECKEQFKDFAVKIQDFYTCLCSFVRLCKETALNPSLVQGRGGNISVKSKSGLIITCSGARLEEVNLNHGFCVCDDDGKRRSGGEKPSMEIALHLKLPEKYIVHTHPIHLNAILCSKEAEELTKKIIGAPFSFVPYICPGNKLAESLPDNSRFLLENHGLIVASCRKDVALGCTENIDFICKSWLVNNSESFIDIKNVAHNLPLFPDAAVFPNEMRDTNETIYQMIKTAGLTPKFLTQEEVEELQTLPSEQYRKSL